jgi:ubiquinone/menaquinone biosynthesis C-methylase UbiE
MMNRRTLFGASAATASFVGALFGSKKASTATTTSSKFSSADVEPRGSKGRLERLPRQHLEAQHDFITGFRVFANRDMTSAARRRIAKIMRAKGIDPTKRLSYKEVLGHVGGDPLVAASARMWLSAQQINWKTLYDEFHGNANAYLAEMEATDNAGPGTLELNPDMYIPEYLTHEIHIQPGGYVGDEFAGHIYHYGTNNFFEGRNDQDELHIGLATAMPEPEDGKVVRVLDQGCSCGQLSVALKERFPDAEVWGIDVGGPMVRYAHMRAVDIGIDVNFAQRLAEDSKFPDNHFDIATNNIMFHEVTTEAAHEILAESFRVLRPGGVYYPIDFYTGNPAPKGVFSTFRQWWDSRWNGEPWRLDYAKFDMAAAMRKAGFIVNENGPPSRRGARRNILGTKPT